MGSPNGEAWVKFGDEATAKRALGERNMHTIGPQGTRYVELYLSSEAERMQFKNFPPPNKSFPSQGYRADFRSQHRFDKMSTDGNECWLRARGLPYSCDETDVVQFFTGHGVTMQDVVIARASDGRPTGEAFVRFLGSWPADEARQALHRQRLGSRYVELFPEGRLDLIFQSASHVEGRGQGCGARCQPRRHEARRHSTRQAFTNEAYALAMPYLGCNEGAGNVCGQTWNYSGYLCSSCQGDNCATDQCNPGCSAPYHKEGGSGCVVDAFASTQQGHNHCHTIGLVVASMGSPQSPTQQASAPVVSPGSPGPIAMFSSSGAPYGYVAYGLAPTPVAAWSAG